MFHNLGNLPLLREEETRSLSAENPQGVKGGGAQAASTGADAARELGLDLRASWIIGDRDTDVWAGQKVGCRTVLVRSPERGHNGHSEPDHRCENLAEACRIILGEPAA